jgi:hypothetical protein
MIYQGQINKKKTWLIRIIETGEVIEYFRTYDLAFFELGKIEKKVYKKCEVVRNEEL